MALILAADKENLYSYINCFQTWRKQKGAFDQRTVKFFTMLDLTTSRLEYLARQLCAVRGKC